MSHDDLNIRVRTWVDRLWVPGLLWGGTWVDNDRWEIEMLVDGEWVPLPRVTGRPPYEPAGQ